MNGSPLYVTVKRLIERGQLDDLQEKLDVFYAVGSITEEQYRELTEDLAGSRD